jgi:hypothetical protein
VKLFADDEWIAKAAYLPPVLIFLNEETEKMQGKNKNILSIIDTIQGFCVRSTHRQRIGWDYPTGELA